MVQIYATKSEMKSFRKKIAEAGISLKNVSFTIIKNSVDQIDSLHNPKRITSDRYPDGLWFKSCPTCHNELMREDQAFCDICGQALEWR